MVRWDWIVIECTRTKFWSIFYALTLLSHTVFSYTVYTVDTVYNINLWPCDLICDSVHFTSGQPSSSQQSAVIKHRHFFIHSISLSLSLHLHSLPCNLVGVGIAILSGEHYEWKRDAFGWAREVSREADPCCHQRWEGNRRGVPGTPFGML